MTAGLQASPWKLTLDGDGRYGYTDWKDHSAELHVASATVKKTFADSRGARLKMFGLFEARDNFSRFMVHEAYGVFKGPMGLWNITAGRFTLPYGLLWNFSTNRLPYEDVYHDILGFDTDNGLQASGTAGRIDYGLSLTQGLGPHRDIEFPGHGLVIFRAGMALGETEEFLVGLSGAAGRVETGHHMTGTVTKQYLAQPKTARLAFRSSRPADSHLPG